MNHSVIIPHYKRETHLVLCLDALIHSAAWGVGRWEVIIAGQPVADLDTAGGRIRQVECETTPSWYTGPPEVAPFWKSHCLNVGMEAAKGAVLTFLDADAIVGSCFMQGVQWLQASSLTKLCYRVRYIRPKDTLNWADYDDYTLAFEAYGDPMNNLAEKHQKGPIDFDAAPVFGNSQFSITRRMMDDLRWDEEYVGRGFEDVAMNRAIWRKYPGYTAAIMRHPAYAMLHMWHLYSPGYGPGLLNDANCERYQNT